MTTLEERKLLPDTNKVLSSQIIESALQSGIEEFCICPGSRNSPLIDEIKQRNLKRYFFYDERSAGFFAIGRHKATNKPVAIVTTSGSAAGELLPSAMEAYYSSIPILLITADRPRSFRGSGAPQAAEQVNLFGVYTPFMLDLSFGEHCNLTDWNRKSPAHLNVCIEEPQTAIRNSAAHFATPYKADRIEQLTLNQFFEKSERPLVVVSTLHEQNRAAVLDFLIKMNAPVYLEAISGLREEPLLQHLRITRSEALWKHSSSAHYQIDGILRIGGVPVFRLWRDLEDKQGQIAVCSISEVPFSGLSFTGVNVVNLNQFLTKLTPRKYDNNLFRKWIEADRDYQKRLKLLFQDESQAEASLVNHLSKIIPDSSQIYLGNSLPIREWDLAADNSDKKFKVAASRGINGIDGQISTFCGLAGNKHENWAILGDLTTLYDLSGPWILSQIESKVNIVVLNNRGGQIFSRLYANPEMLNEHQVSFADMANLWGLRYEVWRDIPKQFSNVENTLIEILPDNKASERFWDRLRNI